MTTELRKALPHQRRALCWARPRKRIALFLQMRLGKTLVALRWIQEHRPRTVLVVAPKSCWEAWEEEFAFEGIDYRVLDGPVGAREPAGLELAFGTTWYLTNYAGLFMHETTVDELATTPRPSPVAWFEWDGVILDESTKIRGPKSKTSRVACEWLGRARVKAILSGLPNPEGPEDFFQQMKFLYGGFMGFRNFWGWRDAYFNKASYDWIPTLGVLKLLKDQVRRRVFFMTRKEAGLGERKIRERRYVDLPPAVRESYVRVEREWALGQLETKWIPVVHVWLARLAGGVPEQRALRSKHKLNELVDLLTGELKREPCIVWFRFNDELRAADRVLRKASVTTVRLHGGVGRNLRKARLTQCRKRRRRVALVQLKLGRLGLDYSFASTAIYYSNDYEYETRAQSEDRIIHPQKKGPLLYVDLITRDTIDEDISAALRMKGCSAALFRSRLVANMKARVKARKRHA